MNDKYDMLSQEALAKIDREVAKYPADQKQSAVMAALVIAQDEKGWLPQEAIAAVAAYLGMAPIAAYEVASFYNMYDLHPVGRPGYLEGRRVHGRLRRRAGDAGEQQAHVQFHAARTDRQAVGGVQIRWL